MKRSILFTLSLFLIFVVVLGCTACDQGSSANEGTNSPTDGYVDESTDTPDDGTIDTPSDATDDETIDTPSNEESTDNPIDGSVDDTTDTPADEPNNPTVEDETIYGKEFKFDLNSDGVSYRVNCDCSGLNEIIIPETYKGLPVTSVTFNNGENLESVSIPNYVNSVNINSLSKLRFNEYDNAYYLGNATNPYVILVKAKNKDITSVKIHDDTTIIRYAAFDGCKQLESLTMGKNVKSIGYDTFDQCYNLKDVYISDVAAWCNIDFYRDDANPLRYADNLYLNGALVENVIIPEGVTSIPTYGFSCQSLVSISIPSSVTSIDSYAFDSCKNLESVYITDIAKWCQIEFGYSYATPLIYADYLYLNGQLLTDLVIPNGIASIPKYSFSCKNIVSVTLPTSITSIGSCAFSDCSSLENVYISDIAKWCSIDFGDSFATPLKYARNFYLNGELITDVAIPEGVISIPYYGFSCKSITSVTIPDSVTSIGEYAFFDCSNLESVIIGNNVTEIGNHAFDTCVKLTNLIIPDRVESIGESTFYWCINLKNITIGKGVAFIGESAFWGCKEIENLYISDIARWCAIDFEIDYWSYDETFYSSNPLYYADNLYFNGEVVTELIIPDGVTSISSYAFDNYTRLNSITIPNSVTTIGSCAFNGCVNLENVYISDIKAWCEISFGVRGSWQDLGNGEYNILEYDVSSNPLQYANNLYLNGELITNLVIPDGVTKISDRAFCSPNIQSVIIPNSVTEIGGFAFDGCYKLENIVLPNSLNKIGYRAFKNCTGLKSIAIPSSVTECMESFSWCNLIEIINKSNIDNNKFYAKVVHNGESILKAVGNYLFYTYDGTNYLCGCTDASPIIELPESYNGEVYWIDTTAFSGNRNIVSIAIPENVVGIKSGAFSGCIRLVEVVNNSKLGISIYKPDSYGSVSKNALSIHQGESEIVAYGDYLFLSNYLIYYCGTDKNLVLPKIDDSNNYQIAKYAFAYTDIKSVIIPNCVSALGKYAFYNCTSLESVSFGTKITRLYEYVFGNCSYIKSITYNGKSQAWDQLYKDKNWDNGTTIGRIVCQNYTIGTNYDLEMDFETLYLPASDRTILLVPLYGYGSFNVIDKTTREIIPWETSGVYYEISNNAGEFTIDEYGTLVGRKGGMAILGIYFFDGDEKIYLLNDQPVFIAECSFENSDSYATFSDSDKEYIQMCLDLAYALPKVSSPTLADLGLLDNFWNAVGDQTKNISEKLKAGKYDPEVAEIKRNLAVIIQNYVDENNLQEYILGNYKVTVETIEALISLKEEGRETEYNLLTEEQKNELDILISAYNNAQDIEGYEKTLSSCNKLLKMLTGFKKTNDNLNKICKWETIETAQRAMFDLNLMNDMVEKGLFKDKFSKLTKVAGFTFDAFLYVMNDYAANIELLELLRDEFVKVDNVDTALKVAIDELIADYSNKSATAWENWLADMGAAQLNGIGNFLIGKLVLPQFGIVKFVVESYAGSTFAAEKFELYTMAMMSSAIYDTLDPIMDMYLTGKQTMPIEKLKTFVSLYLYIVKAENDLVAYNFWSDYPFAEKIDCGNMSQFINNTLGIYLK